MKKGYYLTLDAFIAIGVIVAGLIIVFTSTSHTPFQEQASFFADDLLNILARQTLQDTNDPYLQQLRTDGNVTNLDNTIFEQLGEFYIQGRTEEAENLATSITGGRVPPQYGYSILIDNTVLFATGTPRVDSPVLVRSKAILSGVTNSTFFWGPLEAEVRVWQ